MSDLLNKSEREFYSAGLSLLLLQMARFAMDAELTERDYNSPARLAGAKGVLFCDMHITAYGLATDLLNYHGVAKDSDETYSEIVISAGEITPELLNGSLTIEHMYELLFLLREVEEQSAFTIGEFASRQPIEAFQNVGRKAQLLIEKPLSHEAIPLVNKHAKNVYETEIRSLLVYSDRLLRSEFDNKSKRSLVNPNFLMETDASLFRLLQTHDKDAAQDIFDSTNRSRQKLAKEIAPLFDD